MRKEREANGWASLWHWSSYIEIGQMLFASFCQLKPSLIYLGHPLVNIILVTPVVPQETWQ